MFCENVTDVVGWIGGNRIRKWTGMEHHLRYELSVLLPISQMCLPGAILTNPAVLVWSSYVSSNSCVWSSPASDSILEQTCSEETWCHCWRRLFVFLHWTLNMKLCHFHFWRVDLEGFVCCVNTGCSLEEFPQTCQYEVAWRCAS